MKKLINKIGQNKFQFFFSLGLAVVLLVSLVVSKMVTPKETPKVDDPIVETPTDKPNGNTPDVNVKPEEVFRLPLNDGVEYKVVRKFYEKESSITDQELSLIKYNNSYRTSNGTSFATIDNKAFDVTCVLTGKVLEIKESPLYGKYVVLEHDNKIKTYYYGLSEVTVTVGATVNQGDKLGVSGTTEIDTASGIHVFLKVTKDGAFINPEKAIGKKISEI